MKRKIQGDSKVEHHALHNTKAHHGIVSSKMLFNVHVSVNFLVIFLVYQLLWALLSIQIMFSLSYPDAHHHLFLTCIQSVTIVEACCSWSSSPHIQHFSHNKDSFLPCHCHFLRNLSTTYLLSINVTFNLPEISSSGSVRSSHSCLQSCSILKRKMKQLYLEVFLYLVKSTDPPSRSNINQTVVKPDRFPNF